MFYYDLIYYKKFKIWLIVIYIKINILNKTNYHIKINRDNKTGQYHTRFSIVICSQLHQSGCPSIASAAVGTNSPPAAQSASRRSCCCHGTRHGRTAALLRGRRPRRRRRPVPPFSAAAPAVRARGAEPASGVLEACSRARHVSSRRRHRRGERTWLLCSDYRSRFTDAAAPRPSLVYLRLVI
jgi:hypothetical protein